MILFVSPFPILERVALVGGGGVSSPALSARATGVEKASPMLRVLPLAGGAGVRAARAATACGAANVQLLGFAGGRLGKLLVDRLGVEDLPHMLLPIEGGTRGSLLTLDKERGVVSDVPDSPARATDDEQAAFSDRFSDLLRETNASTVVVSMRNESFPFAPILQSARATDRLTIADVTGDALEEVLQIGVSFLFASLTTLQRRTEESLQNDRAIVAYARTLLCTDESRESKTNSGVSVGVCVTLGEEGALLVTHDNATRIRPPVVSRYKPTGTVEAIVGAFAALYAETNDLEESLALACAFASASVAHDVPAESTMGEANIVRRETVVEPVLLR